MLYSGRYSAFKMYYGRFQYFRHVLQTIIICCHTSVVNGISHIQVEKFGGLDMTAQKHEKKKISNAETSKRGTPKCIFHHTILKYDSPLEVFR